MSDRILRLHLYGEPGNPYCAGCELLDLEDARCSYFGDLYAEKTGEHAGALKRPPECRAAEVFENPADDPVYQKIANG